MKPQFLLIENQIKNFKGLTEEEMNRVKSRLLDENDLSTQQAEASR